MKSSNKLNKAFKDALADKPALLNENQWDRLRADMDKKDDKRRFLPWLFILLPIILVAIAVGYFVGKQSVLDTAIVNPQSTNSDIDMHKRTDLGKQNESTEKPGIRSSENKLQVGEEIPSSSGIEKGKIRNTKSNDFGNEQNLLAEEGAFDHSAIGKKSNISLGETAQDNKETILETETEVITDLHNGNTDEGMIYSHARKPELNEFSIPDPTYPSLLLSKLDPNAASDSLRNISHPTKKIKLDNTRFALGLSTGYSAVVTSVLDLSNANKLHKDTRYLFEESTKNQHSFFINLNFDWNMIAKLRLGLSTGLQYRQISNQLDINYKFNDVPLRQPDGEIVGYFHISDSMNPPTLLASNATAFKFINLPLKLAYAFNIKSFELQVSAGLNFSLLAGSSGVTFSLNEVKTRPVGEMVDNIFNIGYTGGVLVSRQLYKRWWLGVEAQIQNNKQSYNMDYGILKSRVLITNFNLNLRYKF